MSGDRGSKYERLGGTRAGVLTSARARGHQKQDSIASVASDPAELEQGFPQRRPTRIRPYSSDSTADLASHAALMGATDRRDSVDSIHSLGDPGDVASMRRMLDSPRTRSGSGYLDHRNSLFM
jgi:hypothetical protein